MHVGKSIKVALAMSGRSQTWLAKEMGVSTQYLSKLTKKQHCGSETIEKIAGIFEIESSEFVALAECSIGGDNA